MCHPLQCCWFPPCCKGDLGTLWGLQAHACHCCSEAVLLFQEYLQVNLSEEPVCRAISILARKHVHQSSCPTHVLVCPHLWFLCLPLLPRLKYSTDVKAGLCGPAALGKTQLQTLSPVQVSTLHTLWQKIGSTLGISLVPCLRFGARTGLQQQLVGW